MSMSVFPVSIPSLADLGLGLGLWVPAGWVWVPAGWQAGAGAGAGAGGVAVALAASVAVCGAICVFLLTPPKPTQTQTQTQTQTPRAEGRRCDDDDDDDDDDGGRAAGKTPTASAPAPAPASARMPQATEKDLPGMMARAGTGDKYYALYRELGPIYTYMNRIFIVDHEVARLVCEGDREKGIAPCDKPEANVFKSLFFGGARNIVCAKTDSAEWRVAHKGLSAAISSQKNLLKLTETIQENTEAMLRHMDSLAASQESIELSDMLGGFFTELMIISLTGTRSGGEGEATDRDPLRDTAVKVVREDLPIVLDEIISRGADRWRVWRVWQEDVRAAKGSCAAVEQLAYALLAAHRRRMAAPGYSAEADPSILGQMIRTPYASESQRAADVFVVLLAGQDTLRSTVPSLFAELARRPDVARKVREEVLSVAPDASVALDADAVAQMPYLDMVIDENFRLNPIVVSGTSRIAEYDFSYAGKAVRRGDRLQFPTGAIHRDTRLADPDAFRPERWAKDSPEVDVLRKLTMPYSIGPRRCTGQRLAALSLKLVAASIIRRFAFQYDDIDAVVKDYRFQMYTVNDWVKVQRWEPSSECAP